MRLCTWKETGTEYVSDITITEGETEIPCEIAMHSIVPDKLLFPCATDHLPELLPDIPGEITDACLSLNFQHEGGTLCVAWTDSEGHSDGCSYLVTMSDEERRNIADAFLTWTATSMNISPGLYRMQERYADAWAEGSFLYGLTA